MASLVSASSRRRCVNISFSRSICNALAPSLRARFGSGMHLHEEPVDPHGHSRARQIGDEAALTGAGPAGSAGKLDAVSGVEDHRHTQLSQQREGSEVDDQVVVTEAGPPFGDEQVPVSRAPGLLDRVNQVSGRQKLSLLDVDRSSRGSGRDDQIGLTAEERGNLQEVQNLRRRAHVPGFMHVGRDRDTQLAADSCQDLQAAFKSRAPKGANGSPVGLVVGRLEDEGDVESGSDLPETGGHPQGVFFAFDDAWTGNEKEGLPGSEPPFAEFHPSPHGDSRSYRKEGEKKGRTAADRSGRP